MARQRENSCRGCAECIGCGRRERYDTNLICDACGHEWQETLFEVDGRELCRECALDYINDTYADEILENYCDEITEEG